MLIGEFFTDIDHLFDVFGPHLIVEENEKYFVEEKKDRETDGYENNDLVVKKTGIWQVNVEFFNRIRPCDEKRKR